jgi:hypothetical protein
MVTTSHQKGEKGRIRVASSSLLSQKHKNCWTTIVIAGKTLKKAEEAARCKGVSLERFVLEALKTRGLPAACEENKLKS